MNEQPDTTPTTAAEPVLPTIVYCVTGVLMFATLIGGPVSCSMVENRNITERVQAACSGNLSTDAARASACTLALTQRGSK
jgi:hypothetical protein